MSGMSVDKDVRSSLGERRVREMKKMMKKKNAPYFFLAPMLVLFAVFMIYPIIDSLILSFQDFTEGNYVFCGLQNYITMFHDPVFWKSLKNTFIYLAVQVPVMVVLSLLLGVLVEQAFLKFRSGFRMSIFLPSVTALVAYAIVFKLLFNTDFGLVNHALTALGFDGVDWLNTVWGARSAIIIGITWRWTGYNTIIMIAGLKNIPMELYESAEIDGASFFQKFVYITVPMVKSIIVFVSITSTIGTLQLFDESFILTNGGPNNATITIGHYLYNTGFSYYKFGYAAAISYALVVIIGVLSFVQFRITKGGENE
ncbi:lactose transport system permease protein LacF [Lachnospiraceae bacterium]|nr:lactose transport system permease protein LacF [Lachnospiraceae bacterium]